jgi:hypothetical protein
MPDRVLMKIIMDEPSTPNCLIINNMIRMPHLFENLAILMDCILIAAGYLLIKKQKQGTQ